MNLPRCRSTMFSCTRITSVYRPSSQSPPSGRRCCPLPCGGGGPLVPQKRVPLHPPYPVALLLSSSQPSTTSTARCFSRRLAGRRSRSGLAPLGRIRPPSSNPRSERSWIVLLPSGASSVGGSDVGSSSQIWPPLTNPALYGRG